MMFRMKVSGALAAGALAGAAMAGGLMATPAMAETTVLTNVTVIDGTGAPAQPDSGIVMTDGKIAYVGPMSGLKTPEGAKTIDLAGKYVMPGIIDSHVHVGIMKGQTQDIKYYTRDNVIADLKQYAAYGVTSVQILGTDKDLIFNIRNQERAGRPHYARVFTAGQGIVYKGGYGGVYGLNVPVSTPEEARKAVDEQVAKHVNLIKFWIDDERDTIPVKMPYSITKAIIDEAHKKGTHVEAHVFYLKDAKELVRQGIDGFAHQIRDQPVDDELLKMMKAKGTWMVSSTLSRELAYAAPVMPWLQDPFFTRGVTPETLAALKSPAREKQTIMGYTQFPGLPYKKQVYYDMSRTLFQTMENYEAMAKAGIKMGMGTDSGPNGRFPGFNAQEEMYLEVLAGRTPMQAIVSATSDNAEWLKDPMIGTVQKGKWADLLVLDKDPLKDIRNTETINSVYIAGNSVPTIWETCRGRPVDSCQKRPADLPDMPW
jgi:imidazolonepropionase-like amidohydrolase